MKKILVINTGGTISMSEDHTTGKVSPNKDNPLNEGGNIFSYIGDIDVEVLYNLPSPQITENEMLGIKLRILKAVEEGYNGVVITHGTDTLEETAYYLELTLDVNIPIVITGAMRSSNEIGSDGLANLRSALVVAANDESVDKGVLVVMNDEAHTATYVTKTHTTGMPPSKHLTTAGTVLGGRFPAPRASITSPSAPSSLTASISSPLIPAYAFNKYTFLLFFLTS